MYYVVEIVSKKICVGMVIDEVVKVYGFGMLLFFVLGWFVVVGF